jgi:hypothetical protein
MKTGRVFRSAAAGLCALGLGLTVWAAGPAAEAAQRATSRPASHAENVALAAQAARIALAAKYKYTLSRIAFTGSRLAIAATDSHGDLYYFWQKAGTTKWHRQLVASGSRKQAYSRPAIAWTGSAVVIATLDKAGDLIAYTQHVNTTTWKRKQVAKASGGKFQNPSIAAGDAGIALISASSTSGKLLSFELAPGHSNWTPLTAGFGTFGASSVIISYDSLISNYLGLITATSGGTLYFWWERLDLTGWHQETIATPGPSGSFSGGSLAASNAASHNEIVVTAATSLGGVDAWTQSIGSSGWSEQTVATAGSNHYSHPMIAWTGLSVAFPVSYFVITSASQKGKLAFWWDQAGSSSWTQETIAAAGKHAAFANPAISVTGKSTIVTAINTKHGDVDFWYQPFTTNPWHKQLVASG